MGYTALKKYKTSAGNLNMFMFTLEVTHEYYFCQA